MAIRKRIEITLSEEEYEFIKWLSKRDEVSEQTELKMIFNTEFYAVQDLYWGEMKGEGK